MMCVQLEIVSVRNSKPKPNLVTRPGKRQIVEVDPIAIDTLRRAHDQMIHIINRQRMEQVVGFGCRCLRAS